MRSIIPMFSLIPYPTCVRILSPLKFSTDHLMPGRTSRIVPSYIAVVMPLYQMHGPTSVSRPNGHFPKGCRRKSAKLRSSRHVPLSLYGGIAPCPFRSCPPTYWLVPWCLRPTTYPIVFSCSPALPFL